MVQTPGFIILRRGIKPHNMSLASNKHGQSSIMTFKFISKNTQHSGDWFRTISPVVTKSSCILLKCIFEFIHSFIRSLKTAIYLSDLFCSSLLVGHALHLARKHGVNTKLTTQDFVVNCSVL